MAPTTHIYKVKPGITARGFKTAIKDYDEPAVIEELAANSYDAEATTLLIALDTKNQELHLIDDGVGFTKKSVLQAGMLGGGDKQDIPTSESRRPYLGAYGFGLKASANIANKLSIETLSKDGHFCIELDWTRLEEALKSEFEGFDLYESQKPKRIGTGSHIILGLKNPTSEEMLDIYASALANLPDDNGNFRCYVGLFQKIHREVGLALANLSKLKPIARQLARRKLLLMGDPSRTIDLKDCQLFEGKDRQDSSVKYKIYFTGIREGKVLPMKPGLRGIYVRIQGRLLKQSFTEYKFVNPISKWVKFASGIRVELGIDWLRGEVSLSRDSIRFSNPKLEEQFKSTLARVVSGFIQPQLKKLELKIEKKAAREHTQRLELGRKRAQGSKDITIQGISSGYRFIPESDGELALLVANESVMKKVNTSYRLLDYNDKAPFDCLIYDKGKRELVFAELEPTLMEFLQHKNIPDNLAIVICWTLGKWRVGAKKRGVRYYFHLISDTGSKPGHYRLLAFRRSSSKSPSAAFPVIVLDQIVGK